MKSSSQDRGKISWCVSIDFRWMCFKTQIPGSFCRPNKVAEKPSRMWSMGQGFPLGAAVGLGAHVGAISGHFRFFFIRNISLTRGLVKWWQCGSGDMREMCFFVWFAHFKQGYKEEGSRKNLKYHRILPKGILYERVFSYCKLSNDNVRSCWFLGEKIHVLVSSISLEYNPSAENMITHHLHSQKNPGSSLWNLNKWLPCVSFRWFFTPQNAHHIP